MNLPNKLSLLRIFLIPIFMFFYLAEFISVGKIIAIIIFVIAALTDMLDGKIARKYNLVTNLGKLLDPIADKLLVISGLLMVVVDLTLPHPYGLIIAVVIIGRELLISAFRQIAATQNIVMAADKFGKLKTVTQVIALPLTFLYSYFKYNVIVNETIFYITKYSAFTFIALATIFTVLSGINYIIKNKKVFKA